MFVKRDAVMLLHGINLEKWCKRWDMEPFDVPCPGCGKPVTCDIPFAQGQLRGLMGRACGCGYYDHPNHGLPYCAAREPKHGDLLDPDGW